MPAAPVSITPGVSIPVPVTIPGIPAGPVTAIPPWRKGNSHGEPPEKPGNKPCAIAPAKTPAVIVGIIDGCKPPCHRCRVVDASNPSRVVVSCPIHESVAVDVGTKISGRVPDVYDLRGGVIDPNIFYIVDRAFRWDGIDFRWHVVGHNPWSCRAVRDKPDSLVNGIILIVDLDHLGFRIHGVLHVSVLN
jgi:hypothetical protein